MKTNPTGTSLLLVALLIFSLPAAAQIVLVTEQEAIASRNAAEPLVPKSLPPPDAPQINVFAPDIGAPVKSPTRIEVKFQPVPPAVVRPETFQVRYGTLRLDITGRITSASKVTAEGIEVAQASLPKGSHKLLLVIEDSLGRTGERLLQFVVE
jgi:hypothetical protein